MSQSGALCTGILDWAALNGLGFSSFVSLGNKGDLNETDFLEVWRDDPNTNVVMAYLEGVVDGDAFIKASRRLTKVKPFIVVKSGTTSAGSRAVSSHTGTLAGSDTAYDTAFKQAGILRARSVSELFAYSTALAYQPLPTGRRVAIITNAGGYWEGSWTGVRDENGFEYLHWIGTGYGGYEGLKYRMWGERLTPNPAAPVYWTGYIIENNG